MADVEDAEGARLSGEGSVARSCARGGQQGVVLQLEVRSHYEVLGVPPAASAAEIGRAFRQASLLTHPDKRASVEDDTSQWLQLQRAWQVQAYRGKMLLTDSN